MINNGYNYGMQYPVYTTPYGQQHPWHNMAQYAYPQQQAQPKGYYTQHQTCPTCGSIKGSPAFEKCVAEYVNMGYSTIEAIAKCEWARKNNK